MGTCGKRIYRVKYIWGVSDPGVAENVAIAGLSKFEATKAASGRYFVITAAGVVSRIVATATTLATMRPSVRCLAPGFFKRSLDEFKRLSAVGEYSHAMQLLAPPLTMASAQARSTQSTIQVTPLDPVRAAQCYRTMQAHE